MLDQGRIEASEALVVSILREDFRLEPVQGGGEGPTRPPPLARGEHPKRRVISQPFGVVGVFVARQAAMDGRAEKIV